MLLVTEKIMVTCRVSDFPSLIVSRFVGAILISQRREPVHLVCLEVS
jgi:hypothetical protein